LLVLGFAAGSPQLRGTKISNITLRQVLNPTNQNQKVVYGVHTEYSEFYDMKFIGPSYECFYNGGGTFSWHDTVHDSYFDNCGLGGPAYGLSVAAINGNGSHFTVYNNHVTNSGQCIEAGVREAEIYQNQCDGRGAFANPHVCVNLGSTGAGIWNVSVHDNTCWNWGIGAANGNGTLDRIRIENNRVYNGTIGISGGLESNTWGTETDTVVHGTSYIRENIIIWDKVSGNLYGVVLGTFNQPPQYAQEEIVADNNTIYLPNWGSAGWGAPLYLAALTFPAWMPSTVYTTADPDYVQPTSPNGYYYQITTSGTSGTSEPTWCVAVGCMVTDGTAVWTLKNSKPRHVLSNNKVHIQSGVASLGNDITSDGTAIEDVVIDGNMFDYPWTLDLRNSVTEFPSANNGSYNFPANTSFGQTIYANTLPTYGYWSLAQTVLMQTSASPSEGWVVTRAGHAASAWVARKSYGYNAWAVPTVDDGHFYRTLASCRSNSTQPTWPTSAGSTISDGTCIWKESGQSVGFTALIKR
jgi:hypothetical protein